jgi:DNA-binding NarL/FixJ family response regulator
MVPDGGQTQTTLGGQMNTGVEDPEDKQTGACEDARMAAATPAILTPRQLEILTLIAGGRTNKEIAVALGIRERTVKFHVAALFQKLCAVSRTEALVVAIRRGLVQIEER